MSKVTLAVPAMSCGHCEATVRGALAGQSGVNSVQVDLRAKVVHLDYDETTLGLDRVQALLDDAGYPVTGTRDGDAAGGRPRGFIPLRS